MNWSAGIAGLVPPAVVTVTSTVPVPAGEVAVIEVALFTVKVVALFPPNFTAVAPLRFVPVMVTLVPPVVGPDVGLIEVTVGAGAEAMAKHCENSDVSLTPATNGVVAVAVMICPAERDVGELKINVPVSPLPSVALVVTDPR